MTELTRKSNFELLRILAMCQIILIHLASAIDLSILGLSGDTERILDGIISGMSNIGQICFCLISGYFGIKFSLKKLLKFEIMIIIYSLLETFILMQVFPEKMHGVVLLEQLAKSCLPFVSRKYWFYSCYICVFLFSDYIQKYIDTLKKEEFEKIIGLALLVFSVLPTMFYFEIMQDAGKGLIQMTLLYFIGRYIRLYQNGPSNKRKILLLFFALGILNTISFLHPLRVGPVTHTLCRDNSVTNIAMAVILLHLFKDMNFSSKCINKLTGKIFAVFALENSMVNVFAKFTEQSSLYINSFFTGIFLLIGIVLLVFAVCLLLGQIEELLLGRIEDKIIKALMSLITNIKKRKNPES